MTTASKSTGGMGLGTTDSVAVAGVCMAMLGLLALPGGWVADRFLGARRAVFLGGVVIMAGHICLAVPGDAGVWPGLLLIAAGTGLLKTNITSMVGFLGEEVDWHLGFAAAAVGMALGLTQLALGKRRLADSYREPPVVPLTARERRNVLRSAGAAVALLALLALLATETGLLGFDNATYALAAVGLLVPAGYLAHMYRCPHVDAGERVRLKAYIWFFAAAALFWMVYDQMATTLNVFASQKVDLHVFGGLMPASWTLSIPSVFGIVLAPLVGMFWLRKGRNVSTPGRFSLALAPRAFTSQMIGIWFLAAATGDSLGGQVPRLDHVIGQTGTFLGQGVLLVVAGLLMLRGAAWLRTRIGEHRPGEAGVRVAV
ncbi:peptide MFS transporter [Streptomyces sp. N35]|uniref:peptide MFS transporter n=1 Tax=Streptomyces sp. N35 TaxID=2795730 RepID=UPI0018F52655|nr:hypothetical protein [Streptomyces sp. N35]